MRGIKRSRGHDVHGRPSPVAHLILFAVAMSCQTGPRYRGTQVSTGKPVSLVAAPNGAPQSFAGTYLSPQTGLLTLKQAGDRLEGDYALRSCSCEVRGRVEGAIRGNVAQFTWSESLLDCSE